MALASPAYSFAPCRAAPCTDSHGSFCLNFTKCNHPLLADARNKGLALCADLIAYLLYYADIRSRQNICFTPNNSDLTELPKPIDTSNLIVTLNPLTTYTATQECYATVTLNIVGQGGSYSCSSNLFLNDAVVAVLGSQGLATGAALWNTQTFHLLKGDTITINKSASAPNALANIFGVR